MIRYLNRLTLLLWLGAAAAAFSAESRTNRFDADIRAFEAADRTNPPPPNAVLFVGSSSIRVWKTLAADFPQFQVIQRGFGGSHLSDSVHFADRVVIPYRPRCIVVYAGENDLKDGKTPERVLGDWQALVTKVRAALPDARLFFLALKPSPSRWHLASEIRTTNRLIADHCRQDPRRLGFIDVFTPMLDANGNPRGELFQSDRLHLNAQGYRLWAGLIQPRLEAAMNAAEPAAVRSNAAGL